MVQAIKRFLKLAFQKNSAIDKAFTHQSLKSIGLLLLVQLFTFPTLTHARYQDIGPREDLFRVDSIQIRGTRRVEPEAILDRLSTRPEMMLDNHLLRRDLDNIYGLKYFDAVEAHYVRGEDGENILEFHVVEKPVVSEIVFDGNREVRESDLNSAIKTRAFGIIDINTVKNDVQELEKLYEEKGYYLASIEYELVELSEDSVQLVFHIEEFEQVRVKQITFLGNKAFSDDELKSIMQTREETLFSGLSGAGNFKEFDFQTDIERLRYFYQTKGYLQVNLGTPEITVTEDRRWIFITLRVNEGPMFTVNSVSFQGELLFPESELRDTIGLKAGDTYSEELLRQDIERLTEKYQDEGYAFANVLRTLQVVPGENKVDVEFSFEKGRIAYFGRIDIRGNTRTRDKVLRRELRIREGAKFSGSGLRRSRQNIERLGFFEPGSVVFNTVTPEGRDDVLDVEISVQERNTGQISLGAGYSTATGGFFQGSIAQNNFRGKGQTLNFTLNISNVSQSYNLGFTEPYLFDTKWTAGGDIFSTNNQLSDSFTYRRTGFSLRVGYPIFEFTRLFLSYKFEDTRITALEDPTIDEETENGIASSVRTTLVNDHRNNRFETTAGHYISLSTEYAGIGGDKKWWRNELDARYFHTVWRELVLRSRVFVGKMETVGGQAIPRSELYTLGGSRNLRGFSYEDVGPKREVTDNQGRVRRFNAGSEFATFAQLEFEHPLAREAGLKWVLFADAGDANDPDSLNIKANYGFGFRWFSPIGILRFEFGYPIRGDEGSGNQFHFDIGQSF